MYTVLFIYMYIYICVTLKSDQQLYLIEKVMFENKQASLKSKALFDLRFGAGLTRFPPKRALRPVAPKDRGGLYLYIYIHI